MRPDHLGRTHPDLAGGAAQLGVGARLIRWLPAAGRHPGRLVWSALLLIMPLAGVVGLVHLVAVVPVTAGGVAALLPVAVGYIVVQVACVVAVLVFPAARRADVEVPSP